MQFLKDPDAVLDYVFDWKANTNGSGTTDWLDSSEIITDHTVTASSGLTVDSSAITNTATSVQAWLSGGTAGTKYTVHCHIQTSANREDDRVMIIYCVER